MDRCGWRRFVSAKTQGNWPLVLTGCFALIWMVHRAQAQSITFDEANTFLGFVAEPGWHSVWSPDSNNHVLNTILIRLLVQLFGVSHLTMRAPALFGGAVYILAAYRLCTLLSRDLTLQWPLFVCLVYNPFVMDYLVAARGYGLAIGLLSLAAYFTVRTLLRLDQASEREMMRKVTAASVCAALSFCANFSYAYVNAALIAVLLAWACARIRKQGPIACARLAFASLVPACVVAIALTGPMLAQLPRSQLYWGAHSLKETSRYVHRASFTGLNRNLLPPILAGFLEAVQPHLVRAVGRLLALYLALLLLNRRLRDSQSWPRLRVAGSVTAVLSLALLAHWLQFKFLRIPLPLDRTSLFIVPLCMVIVAAVFSVIPATLLERVVRGFGIGVLFIVAAYFIGSLRDSYFQEWRGYGADVEAAFPAIVDVSRRVGAPEVAADWKYVPSLNFYRVRDAAKGLDEFRSFDRIPPGKPIYVLPENEFKDFIRTERLQVVYRGAISDLVVAIRPGAGPLK